MLTNSINYIPCHHYSATFPKTIVLGSVPANGSLSFSTNPVDSCLQKIICGSNCSLSGILSCGVSISGTFSHKLTAQTTLDLYFSANNSKGSALNAVSFIIAKGITSCNFHMEIPVFIKDIHAQGNSCLILNIINHSSFPFSIEGLSSSINLSYLAGGIE